MVFPSTVRKIRGPILDYLTGRKEATLDWTHNTVRNTIITMKLSRKEALKIIDKILEDPLCTPHISQHEKTEKLNLLKKLLADLVDLEATKKTPTISNDWI